VEPTLLDSSQNMNWFAKLPRSIWLILGALAIFVPTIFDVARLSWSTEQGAHGPIVLSTGVWLLFQRWAEIKPLFKPAPNKLIIPLFLGLATLYFLSSVTQVIEVQGYVMYALLITLLLSEIGLTALSKLAFPLTYLLFMFPPPDTLVAMLTQPMKIYISQLATWLLHGVGYPIGSSGVTIQVGQYQLLVAAACSGLNSIISLSAISLFYVYMRHRIDLTYAAFMMMAILPVAIFANFVRVLILILLTYHGGEAAAQGFLHGFAGLSMFLTALVTIFLIDKIAEPIFARVRGKVR
jgi:exosortase